MYQTQCRVIFSGRRNCEVLRAMELTRRIMIFLALLILPLILFMYNHSVSVLNTEFRHYIVPRIIGLVPRNTSERIRMQFLSRYDKAAFDGCGTFAGVEREIGSCYFMNQTLRLPVALASLQGSGSTWVRGLLEQATGICTGSVYCDPWLRASGFSGENVRSGAVVVTKTHYPAFIEGEIIGLNVTIEDYNMLNDTGVKEETESFHSTVGPNETTAALYLIATKDSNTLSVKEGIEDATTLHLTEDLETPHFIEGTNKHRTTFNTTQGIEEDPNSLYVISNNSAPHWGAAIVIVRNPFHALVAEYNRRGSGDIDSVSSHVDSLGENEFGSNKRWNEFVYEFAPKWKAMIDYYFKSERGYRRLCVMFESLKRDPLSEVKRMLDFLHIEYNEMELRGRLQKTFSTFRRSHKREFEHFTHEQKTLVNLVIRSALESLKDSELAEQMLIIKDYIVSTANDVTQDR